MKITKIAAAVTAVMIWPVLFCSCSSSDKEKTKEEPSVPKQETPVQEETQAVEVKADAKTEAALAAQEAKKAEEPLPPPALKEEKPAPVVASTPKKEEKKSVPPCEHTVCTGDNLWKIARKYYGTGSQWKLIYESNRDKIKKADFLEPGTVLAIPAAK